MSDNKANLPDLNETTPEEWAELRARIYDIRPGEIYKMKKDCGIGKDLIVPLHRWDQDDFYWMCRVDIFREDLPKPEDRPNAKLGKISHTIPIESDVFENSCELATDEYLDFEQ